MTPEQQTKPKTDFDIWWTGPMGEYSRRCEWPQNEFEAAYMAWAARQEEIDRLRTELAASEARVEKTDAMVDKTMDALLTIAGHPELYRTTAYDIARTALKDITRTQECP